MREAGAGERTEEKEKRKQTLFLTKYADVAFFADSVGLAKFGLSLASPRTN